MAGAGSHSWTLLQTTGSSSHLSLLFGPACCLFSVTLARTHRWEGHHGRTFQDLTYVMFIHIYWTKKVTKPTLKLRLESILHLSRGGCTWSARYWRAGCQGLSSKASWPRDRLGLALLENKNTSPSSHLPGRKLHCGPRSHFSCPSAQALSSGGCPPFRPFLT